MFTLRAVQDGEGVLKEEEKEELKEGKKNVKAKQSFFLVIILEARKGGNGRLLQLL